jgi:hypothetical protein
MSKRKGDVAPQNRGTVPQALRVRIEGGKRGGRHKNDKAVRITALLTFVLEIFSMDHLHAGGKR